MRLYTSGVCSSFTHGCKAWKMNIPVCKMINGGFNSRCLSVIIGKEFNVTAANPDFNLIDAITKRRLRFAGHILRMNPDRLLRRRFMTYINSHPGLRGSFLHNCEEMSIEQTGLEKTAILRTSFAGNDRRLWEIVWDIGDSLRHTKMILVHEKKVIKN